MLTLNSMKAQPGANRNRKRLGRGRGSGLGGTSGKGHKGQRSRSGAPARPGFEGGQTPLYRRLPKRGFTSYSREVPVVLNLKDLEVFSGDEVSLEILKKTRRVRGKVTQLRILGQGELQRAVKVKAHKVSKTALEKIQKAGGSVEVVEYPSLLRKRIAESKERSKSKS